MFTRLPLDRRAHAILICQLLADRVEDDDVPLEAIGRLARELATHLLDELTPGEAAIECPIERRAGLRVIEGGRHRQ